MPTDTVICAVCGSEADLKMSAECNWCDQRYHLNQRNDVEAKDCGAVWIDEQYLALQFACDNCLRGAAAESAPADAVARLPRARPTDRPRRYKRRA